MYYRKRKENPADYSLGTLPLTPNPAPDRKSRRGIRQLHCHNLNTNCTALTLSMVAKTTGRDLTLRALMDAVQSGRWYNGAKHPTVDPDHRNNIDTGTGCVLKFLMIHYMNSFISLQNG